MVDQVRPEQPDEPSTARLAAAFGLDALAPRSLSPWARVFRGAVAGRAVVVKRTATRADPAAAMAAWTRAAAAAGFPVVAPAVLGAANPQQVGRDWWVVYPWVAGEPYRAGPEQVRLAGDLLGRQHALDLDTSALRPYRWPAGDRDEIGADLERLERKVPDLTPLRELATRWLEHALPALRDADLPYAGVSSDYKAANLVYAPSGPVLVDPDNGGAEPRLLDLALAAVLFHHECPTAPGRLFSPGEWRLFVDAYSARVTLSPVERALWPAALDHLLWEEGSWALDDNDDDAWADPRQGAFLRDLATAGPDRFPLL